MYFCPNCSYSFDINKSSTSTFDTNEKKIVKKIPDLFKLIDADADIENLKFEFTREELSANKQYKKLSENIKNKLNNAFDAMVSFGAELKCNNCNNTEQIKETLLLYQISMNNVQENIKSLEENKFIAQDPLLPHTRDYQCKNPNCITHKNSKIKDVVFYRNKVNFKVNYICTVCNFSW